MGDDIRFKTQTGPMGYSVECSEERWRVHILNGSHRAEMEGKEGEVVHSIESPFKVMESKNPPNRHVYLGSSSTPWEYTKVVVQPPDKDGESGKFVTAFVTDTIGENVGKVIYDVCKP